MSYESDINITKNPVVAKMRTLGPVDVKELLIVPKYDDVKHEYFVYMGGFVRTEHLYGLRDHGQWTFYQTEITYASPSYEEILNAYHKGARALIGQWREDHPKVANIVPLRARERARAATIKGATSGIKV